MIDARRLLNDCQVFVRDLEHDLREQVDQRSDLAGALAREHREAVDAKRTKRSREEWERERITQAAVAWVLGCIFVRFLEDNALVDPPRLSGEGPRLRRARDEEAHYFRQYPERTAREYLEDTFRGVAGLPGCGGLFGERHNPLWQLEISGDAARDLLDRWRAIDPQSGTLIHDFADQVLGTRFLGDLYQDLSESARKQYALLQTPEFVEEFILERTLEPAIDEFGLETVTLIDPACGSGHFLLGAFARLLSHWRAREPGTDVRTLVERSLNGVSGVDLNPFAAAIARFRLLVAAVHVCGVTRLRDAPNLRLEIAVGDALLHGTRPGRLFADAGVASSAARHLYATEDAAAIARVLDRRYHVVVANPPYITPKDPALNEAYRRRFSACSGKYALSVPFMELLFDLALPAENTRAAGYVGQITSNSFMKREFGRKLVEEHLARLDLTLIIDTSGAHIPGHNTPTVILVGRSRAPLALTVRTVMGIRGEPATPADPACGLVWAAILEQVDRPGSESAYVTVEDVPRDRYAKHPWSIGGGGASDLRARVEATSNSTIDAIAESVGIASFTLEDDVYVRPRRAFTRAGADLLRPLTVGDEVRDWRSAVSDTVFFPYDADLSILAVLDGANLRALWPYRTNLANNVLFGARTKAEAGMPWFEFGRLTASKLRTPLSITFAEVATHNHFVLDRGGKIFNRTAPVIKLPMGASEDEHLGLLGLLNSSTAEFWMRQVMQARSGFDERWEMRLQRDATKMGKLPLPNRSPVARARRLDALAQELAASLPVAVQPTTLMLAVARDRAEALRGQMIAVQEELDWEVYHLYGLLDEDLTHRDPPGLRVGERAFEIVLARRIAAGEEQTTWFERHRSTPVTEPPVHWHADYRALVERRIALIESDRDLGLIERPECKRRWQWEPWERQQERVLRGWLLDRLEEPRYWGEPRLTSCARLADEARKDAEFRSVAEVYSGRADVDLATLVETLVTGEAVPFLASWRYTDTGMRVRAAWERTWELQHAEDAIDALRDLPEDDPHRLTPEKAASRKQVEVGPVPVPPKYTSKDFRKSSYWQHRGKLDVPKERFILYPGCERAADPSPVIGWAGWNHLERAQALAHYLTRMRQEEQWGAERLTPLLAGVAEMLPWVLQWHNVVDPSLGRRVGDAYSDFLQGQLAELGLTRDDLAAWRPPPLTRGRRTTTTVVTS